MEEQCGGQVTYDLFRRMEGTNEASVSGGGSDGGEACDDDVIGDPVLDPAAETGFGGGAGGMLGSYDALLWYEDGVDIFGCVGWNVMIGQGNIGEAHADGIRVEESY